MSQTAQQTEAERLTQILQQLDNPETPDREWVAKGLRQLGKVRLADRVRLMADNQRVLNTTGAADRVRRELAHEIERWNFERVKGDIGGRGSPSPPPVPGQQSPGMSPKDDEMNIFIDSPIYPGSSQGVAGPVQQVVTPSRGLGSLGSALMTAAAIAIGAAGSSYFMRPNPTPPPAPIIQEYDDVPYLLDLLPADAKKQDPQSTDTQPKAT